MKWISVKDRLPNIRDVVLVYYNSGMYCVMCYCGDDGKLWFGKSGHYENVYHERGIDLFECITHWMPLPEPPIKR